MIVVGVPAACLGWQRHRLLVEAIEHLDAEFVRLFGLESQVQIE